MDQLSERLKELTNNVAILRKQKESQQAETKAAQTALREASAEVDAVAMERKELQQQWEESTAGLFKRDEALAALEAAVQYV